jgi:hypothetical protein
MTEHLFLGGPWDHRWHDVSDDTRWRVNYPIFPSPTWWTEEVDPIGMEIPQIGTYTRRRMILPPWAIMLEIYTCDGEFRTDRNGTPVLPDGTVLPGVIYGTVFAVEGAAMSTLPQSRLCPNCRTEQDHPPVRCERVHPPKMTVERMESLILKLL